MLTRLFQCPIDSNIYGKQQQGKWYYAMIQEAHLEQDAVVRYLQANGEWNRICHWFDSKAEVEQALAIGIQPDFTLSEAERAMRNDLRLLSQQLEEMVADQEDSMQFSEFN